jgi:hypothetical protein
VSRRSEHAEEMRYALAHRCSLAEARLGLAKERWRLRDAAMNGVGQREAFSGRDVLSTGPMRERAATPDHDFWWNRD